MLQSLSTITNNKILFLVQSFSFLSFQCYQSLFFHQGKYFKWPAMLSFVRLYSTVPLFLNTLQLTGKKSTWAFCQDLGKQAGVLPQAFLGENQEGQLKSSLVNIFKPTQIHNLHFIFFLSKNFSRTCVIYLLIYL